MTTETTAKRHIPLYGTLLTAQVRYHVKEGNFSRGTTTVHLQGFIQHHGLDETETEQLISYLDGYQGEAPNFRLDADTDRRNLLVTIT